MIHDGGTIWGKNHEKYVQGKVWKQECTNISWDKKNKHLLNISLTIAYKMPEFQFDFIKWSE